MEITHEDLQKARRISRAIQEYLEMTKKEGVRSTDVYPYLAKKGLVEKDRHDGLQFRRFLRKLKANNLLNLIPQCTCNPGLENQNNEWYFYKVQVKRDEIAPEKLEEERTLIVPEITSDGAKDLVEQYRSQIDNLPKSDRLFTIQQEETRMDYPRAYEQWTGAEEKIMQDVYVKTKSIGIVGEILRRQPSAVQKRLQESGILPVNNKESVNKIENLPDTFNSQDKYENEDLSSSNEYLKSPEEVELDERIQDFISQCPFEKKCEPQLVYKYHEMGGKVFVLQCAECGRASGAPIARSKLESIDYIDIHSIPLISNPERSRFNKYMLERALNRDKHEKMIEEYSFLLQKEVAKDKKEHLCDILKMEWTNDMRKIYAAYLQSDYWTKKRTQIFIRDNYKCRLCDNKASVVHHISYKNLGQESNLELISLCDSCHSLVHGHNPNELPDL